VQEYADDVEACLTLLEDAIGTKDADQRQVAVLVRALAFETALLADEINRTALRLTGNEGA
jgi:hypothetical protein